MLRIVGVRPTTLVRPGRPVRHVVTLGFILRGPAKVMFEIQGPAPSCEAVRRLAVKGHRGMNRLRITSRPGGKPLRQGVYRVVVQGKSPAKVIGVRVRKDGRIVPVKTSALPAGWCVARYSALSSTPFDVTPSSPSARPAAFAPASPAVERTRITGGVHAARAELRSFQVGPAKVALGVVRATASGGGQLLRWFAIGVVGFLALSFPAVLVAATWRDLTRRGDGRLT